MRRAPKLTALVRDHRRAFTSDEPATVGTEDGLVAVFGKYKLAVDPGLVNERPALFGQAGEPVVFRGSGPNTSRTPRSPVRLRRTGEPR